MDKPLTILLHMGETLKVGSRSGIQRVALKLAAHLGEVCTLDLVCWDALEGGLRFLDRVELGYLFGRGAWPAGVRLRRDARIVRTRFGELLDDPEHTWLLYPELPYHSEHGLQAFGVMLTQCREYGVRTAAIFYDQIPLESPQYSADAGKHLAYLAELTRADLVLPISDHSGRTFEHFYTERGLQAPRTRVAQLGMAEGPQAAVSAAGGRTVLVVGTVEPRKRQLEIVRAYAEARKSSARAAEFQLVLIGSLHPAVARAFEALVARTPGVTFRNYVTDQALDEAYRNAAFTVFASDREGYGLPVAESLARGVPCICADAPPMTEIAAGGGCRTVDVKDPAEIAAAIADLCDHPDTLAALRAGIAARRLRTWRDYAAEVTSALGVADEGFTAGDVVVLAGDASTPAKLHASAAADVLTFADAAARDAFVTAASTQQDLPMLTARMAVGEEAARGIVADLSRFRGRLNHIARVERSYAQARRAVAGTAQARRVFLRIVISTYNRREFVLANVRWLLDKVARGRGDIELVVVDNASTDGTYRALKEAFEGRPVRIVVNAANVGMLGNMRVVAELPGAEYVWLIGDDDFIVPGAVDGVIAPLKASLGVPLAYLNFGVYHREAFGIADTPERLQTERFELAKDPIDSGVYPVRVVAAQHDNLFTAIYINIWRADVLAAAYDYPFDGRPFGDLVESIPCTKLILESFGAADAYWHKPICIVGNAHNSWARHRPRWHGLLMPEALALARDAGADPTVLFPWVEHQGRLYDEALALAGAAGTPLNMDEPDVYDLSWKLMRRRLAREAAR